MPERYMQNQFYPFVIFHPLLGHYAGTGVVEKVELIILKNLKLETEFLVPMSLSHLFEDRRCQKWLHYFTPSMVHHMDYQPGTVRLWTAEEEKPCDIALDMTSQYSRLQRHDPINMEEDQLEYWAILDKLIKENDLHIEHTGLGGEINITVPDSLKW